jgi:hypothetical protein
MLILARCFLWPIPILVAVDIESGSDQGTSYAESDTGAISRVS